MTEKDKEEGRREGVVDLTLKTLEKRIARIEKLIASIVAAAAAGWAKIQGWL